MNPFTALPKLLKSKKYVDEIERDVKAMKQTTWKTSLAGIATCILSLGLIWAPSEYKEKIEATALALAGVGLWKAQDAVKH